MSCISLEQPLFGKPKFKVKVIEFLECKINGVSTIKVVAGTSVIEADYSSIKISKFLPSA